MNRTIILALAAAVGASSGLAADHTWTGKISDSMCGARHQAAVHGAQKISDRQCTLGCVKNGAKYVFVHRGKVYNIENQDYAALKDHAGETVRLTGDVNGNRIKVSNLEAVSHGHGG
ncbi:MAG: hypothetical protein ACRD6B_05465 [Bryobacteraceae bacterium]